MGNGPHNLSIAIRQVQKEWDAWCDDYVALQDRERALEATLREIRERSNCPRPMNHRPEEFTAAQCIAAGECGCVYGPPAKMAVKPCEFCDGQGHEAQKKCVHCDGTGTNIYDFAPDRETIK